MFLRLSSLAPYTVGFNLLPTCYYDAFIESLMKSGFFDMWTMTLSCLLLCDVLTIKCECDDSLFSITLKHIGRWLLNGQHVGAT